MTIDRGREPTREKPDPPQSTDNRKNRVKRERERERGISIINVFSTFAVSYLPYLLKSIVMTIE
jgi:hypothetical protein